MYHHPILVGLLVVIVISILTGIGGAVITAFQTRKSYRNSDDAFWQENGDTWLGP